MRITQLIEFHEIRNLSSFELYMYHPHDIESVNSEISLVYTLKRVLFIEILNAHYVSHLSEILLIQYILIHIITTMLRYLGKK